jgi:5-deoxy-glucuronate isomerase
MQQNGNAQQVLFQSAPIPPDKSGTLVSITRQQAGWQTVSFSVRRLLQGQYWQSDSGPEEVALVALGGKFSLDWGTGPGIIGNRANVFRGYPHAAYLPPRTAFEVSADTTCEFADCRAPSDAKLAPRVITPSDIRLEIRGGGNATRQILDIIGPDFPAHRLLICEVYTPSGNWSSYPPHKHDVHNMPVEADLDETYYYRIDRPEGYAFQRLYDAAGTRDVTLKVTDGDLVLIRDGYHPVVAAYGYNVYYLNVLAGSAHSFAASDDPRYVHLRRNWPAPDPRVPVVRPEAAS